MASPSIGRSDSWRPCAPMRTRMSPTRVPLQRERRGRNCSMFSWRKGREKAGLKRRFDHNQIKENIEQFLVSLGEEPDNGGFEKRFETLTYIHTRELRIYERVTRAWRLSARKKVRDGGLLIVEDGRKGCKNEHKGRRERGSKAVATGRWQSKRHFSNVQNSIRGGRCSISSSRRAGRKYVRKSQNDFPDKDVKIRLR